MSEKEIMQGINRTISFMKEELKAEHSCFTIQELYSLQSLLDLYEKEKETNKELLTRLRADGLIERDKYWINKMKENLIKKDNGCGCWWYQLPNYMNIEKLLEE